MLKNSKFTELFESLMTRYRIGSFLVGDQVKILDSIKGTEEYKNLPIADKEIIDNLMAQEANGDIILKIVSLNVPPFRGGTPVATPETFEIGVECGGGRYMNVVSLPGTLIKTIQRIDTDGTNVPAMIAPNNKVSYTNNPDVHEVLSDEDAEGIDQNAVPVKQKVHKMPTKDNKIGGGQKKPAVTDHRRAIKSTMGELDVDTKALA